jgi:leucyl/phenylalanyl-tRNA--protein transferase
LVGGLYGVVIGKCFFGESMFHKISNASKFGFIHLVEQLKLENFAIIDCQVYTQHLESLGAKYIDRKYFLDIINNNI